MRRPVPPLRAYLSYPMTLATMEDLRIVADLRNMLRGWKDLLTFYDPDQDEDKSNPLWQIQDDDYQQLGQSDLLLPAIVPGTANSKGECAEIEWAVRSFNRPVVLWNPECIQLPPWIDATLQNGRSITAFTASQLFETLAVLRNTTPF